MLTRADNDLLTLVDGGAPMGRYLREYWVPAIRSARATAGGAPVKVRLFGENFVAFRAADGSIGFLDERCPHRGASLALARNEDCALRCLFHGWRIDVSGFVTETPSEPGNIGDKVRVRSFPTKEAGGLVWVYLGADDVPPPFPDFPFNGLPDSHVRPVIAETRCNWFQAVEGTLDSSHVSILHQSWLGLAGGTIGQTAEDSAPGYEYDDTEYGVRFAAIRKSALAGHAVRITEFIAPWTALIPTGDEDQVAIIGTPIDDQNSRQFFIRWNNDHPLTEDTDAHYWYHPLTATPDDFTELVRGKENWGQDRERMAQGHFSGYDNLILEDVAIQESQGPIVDRSLEKLGSSDVAVIRVRRLLLAALRRFDADRVVFGRSASRYPRLAGSAFTIPGTADWREQAAANEAARD